MKDYHINIFYSEEDRAYVADIPDLKFCSAFGDTPEGRSPNSGSPANCGAKPPRPRANRFRSRATDPPSTRYQANLTSSRAARWPAEIEERP